MPLNNSRIVLIILALASLLNISPLFFFDLQGDIFVHWTFIDCFGSQFWQGDLYPRWCMDANAGLGSPAPLFYFPLPYYVTSLLYPLKHLGLSTNGLLILACYLATFVTAISCFYWLKDIVSRPCALLATLVFLFMPYRMELLFFRVAYAELWQVAFLPLAFKYTRRMALGDKAATIPLALVFGLSLLSHLPCAAISFLFTGTYLLLMSGKDLAPKRRYAASVVGGLSLAAFYIVPGAHYMQFLAPVKLVDGLYGWPNAHVHLVNFTKLGQWPPMMACFLILVSLAGLSFAVLRKRSLIPDGFIRCEITAWSVMVGIALFLFLPVSEPLYAIAEPLSRMFFPWRMQVVFPLAFVFILAVYVQWLASDRRRKTWKGDYATGMALLSLIGLMLVTSPTPEAAKYLEHTRLTQTVISREYRTLWTDKDHYDLAYTLPRYDHRETLKKITVLSHGGVAEAKRWAWGGIELHTQSAKPMTLRLDHYYFPPWQASDEAGQPVRIYPEDGTGQMLLDVPAGEHRVVLHYKVTSGALAFVSGLISALAAMLLALLYVRRGRAVLSP